MAAQIRDFRYSKTRGRGRGILGLMEFSHCKRPGSSAAGDALPTATSTDGNDKDTLSDTNNTRSPGAELEVESKKPCTQLVVALYNYVANTDSPGGFRELPLQKGQLLELLGECPDNEHWWRVRNEDGEEGFAPSSYLLVKEEKGLPWLQASALKEEEEERKMRVSRLAQQRAALEGKGFGPPPKDLKPVCKPYVSSYNRETSSQPSQSFFCEVCQKQLNGPKPYQAHMVSKGHKEELALLESA